MTITWETTITVKDTGTKECSVKSIRTDDSTTPDTVNTINIVSVLLTSQEEGDKVIDAIYELYETEAAKETQISNILSTYENYMNTQLGNKET